MKVICAGAPKTGTKSLAKALRILGYDPVYDAEEAIEYAFQEWEDVWNEKQPDMTVLMDTVYADVDAVVDVPHSTFFDHFLERWPDAKVILMTRDSDSWFLSFKKMSERAEKDHGHVQWLQHFSPSMKRFLKFQEKNFESMVGGFIPHSFIWKAWYKRHNTYVREIVPKSQLLEYNVTQGWKPLCDFLGKPVPEEDFPFENRALDARNIADKVMEETWIAKKAARELTLVFTIVPVLLILFLSWYFFL